MNCHDLDLAIGDYVDGQTGSTAAGGATDADARRLQGHLAACPRCAALEADLRAIRVAARALPQHEPAPHVWSAIAATAAAAERNTDGARRGVLAGGAFWQRAWRPIAAAAMAVIVTATLADVGTRLEPLRQAPGTAPVQAAAADPAAAEAVQQAEGEYIQAINGLEVITSTASDTLDPETADVLRANLTVIDQAIGESRAAIKEEPESQLAIASLFEALRSKLALLQDMVALINEMRQGNAEGAARIASGLNQ